MIFLKFGRFFGQNFRPKKYFFQNLYKQAKCYINRKPHRTEHKNIFSKIFWPFCTKLQKVKILGVGGLGAEGPQTAFRRLAERGPKARAFNPSKRQGNELKSRVKLCRRGPKARAFNPSKRQSNELKSRANFTGEGRRPELSTHLKGRAMN